MKNFPVVLSIETISPRSNNDLVFFNKSLSLAAKTGIFRNILEPSNSSAILIKYVEAEKIEDVRKFLQNEDITIEFIETLSPDHLEYERDNNADFKVTKVNE